MAQVQNIRTATPDGGITYYSGDSSGISALGANTNVYNVPDGNGGFYSGAASGFGSPVSSVGTPSATPTPTNTGQTPYVSSSDTVVQGENKTLADLQKLMGSQPDYNNLLTNYKDATDTIANYSTQLEARRKASIEGINASYDTALNDTKTAQANEKGSTNASIIRLGGYLGESGSGNGVMQNLALTHRAELGKLASQRDAAIQAANNAIDDKQFALAQAKIDEANKITSDIYTRQQDFFSNSIKLQGAQQDQLASQRTQAADLLDKWSTLPDPSGISTSDKSFVDSIYGSGFTDKYLVASQAASAAKSQKDKIDAMKSYVDLIQSVPAGTSIPFGDSTITGIGSTSDITTFQETDGSGNVRIVSYNKGDGSYSIANMGQIGKGDSTGGDASLPKYQQYIAPGQTLPGTSTKVLDINGYMNPEAWKNFISDYVARSGSNAAKARSDFISTYGHYLYPGEANDFAGYGLTPTEQKVITGQNF